MSAVDLEWSFLRNKVKYESWLLRVISADSFCPSGKNWMVSYHFLAEERYAVVNGLKKVDHS